jgi:hypothetical protein
VYGSKKLGSRIQSRDKCTAKYDDRFRQGGQADSVSYFTCTNAPNVFGHSGGMIILHSVLKYVEMYEVRKTHKLTTYALDPFEQRRSTTSSCRTNHFETGPQSYSFKFLLLCIDLSQTKRLWLILRLQPTLAPLPVCMYNVLLNLLRDRTVVQLHQ